MVTQLNYLNTVEKDSTPVTDIAATTTTIKYNTAFTPAVETLQHNVKAADHTIPTKSAIKTKGGGDTRNVHELRVMAEIFEALQ